MNNAERIEKIKSILEKSLSPLSLNVIDESQQHVGHAGAATGMGHFAVEITSQCFEGKNPIQRHQLVYDALGDLMETDIHAIKIKASTPA